MDALRLAGREDDTVARLSLRSWREDESGRIRIRNDWRRKRMKPRLLILVLLGTAMLASAAGAATLWDQTDFDPWGAGFYNSESGAPPMGITMHTVGDVTVDCGWLVTSITQYYSALDMMWGEGITQGYLHVYPKTGPLPIDGVDDPTADPLVPVSAVLNGDHWVVTASGLSIDLMPGSYWIGFTPIAPGGMWGPEIHLSSMSAPIGDASASYDPYGMPVAWMNFNPGVDTAVLIEGEVTGPSGTENATWGRIKALYQD